MPAHFALLTHKAGVPAYVQELNALRRVNLRVNLSAISSPAFCGIGAMEKAVERIHEQKKHYLGA